MMKMMMIFIIYWHKNMISLHKGWWWDLNFWQISISSNIWKLKKKFKKKVYSIQIWTHCEDQINFNFQVARSDSKSYRSHRIYIVCCFIDKSNRFEFQKISKQQWKWIPKKLRSLILLRRFFSTQVDHKI